MKQIIDGAKANWKTILKGIGAAGVITGLLIAWKALSAKANEDDLEFDGEDDENGDDLE